MPGLAWAGRYRFRERLRGTDAFSTGEIVRQAERVFSGRKWGAVARRLLFWSCRRQKEVLGAKKPIFFLTTVIQEI